MLLVDGRAACLPCPARHAVALLVSRQRRGRGISLFLLNADNATQTPHSDAHTVHRAGIVGAELQLKEAQVSAGQRLATCDNVRAPSALTPERFCSFHLLRPSPSAPTATTPPTHHHHRRRRRRHHCCRLWHLDFDWGSGRGKHLFDSGARISPCPANRARVLQLEAHPGTLYSDAGADRRRGGHGQFSASACCCHTPSFARHALPSTAAQHRLHRCCRRRNARPSPPPRQAAVQSHHRWPDQPVERRR